MTIDKAKEIIEVSEELNFILHKMSECTNEDDTASFQLVLNTLYKYKTILLTSSEN